MGYLNEHYSQISQQKEDKEIKRNKKKENLAIQKNSSLEIETDIFPCPGAIITFSLLIVAGISETRTFPFDADAVFGMFSGPSNKCVIYIFSHFFFAKNIFFR